MLRLLLICLALNSTSCSDTSETTKASIKNNEVVLKDGDIVFQSTKGEQSTAVELATHSPHSHCGIIFMDGDKAMVWEAVGPVSITPLDEWTGHGRGGHYVVKRLINYEEVLTTDVLRKMKAYGSRMMGKKYDFYFGWSDDLIYCSELVWKMYDEAAGIEVGKVQQLKDFDLDHAIIQAIMKERYGENVPYEETVISPAAIFDSPLLEEVLSR